MNFVLDVFNNEGKMNSVELTDRLQKLKGIVNIDLHYTKDGASKPLYENTNFILALIHIINSSENLECCSIAIEILWDLLQTRTGYFENHRKKLAHFFTQPAPFQKLFETLHLVQEFSQKLETPSLKLLKIFDCLSTKRPRQQFSCVEEKTIKCVTTLLLAWKDSKEHSELLISLAKQISRTKKFCPVLGTRDFFESLQNITMKTHDFETAVRIIKPMVKCHEALNEMRQADCMVTFLLDLIDSNAGTKKQLIAALYKVAKKVPHKVSEPHIWQRLLKYFKTSEKFDEDRFHMSIIKMYTLLNLSSRRTVIASTHYEFQQQRQLQNDSESDNDTDEEENDINHNPDSELSDSISICSEDSIEPLKEITPCDMQYFFRELLPDCEWVETENCEDLKGVKKTKHLKQEAYPDEVEAEADLEDDQYLSSSTHKFDIASMIKKLNVVNGSETQFRSNTVYDLDALVQNGDENGNYKSPSAEDISGFRGTKMYFEDDKTNENLQLSFESRFESGNLRRVEQVASYEYDLYLTPDTSTCRGRQWFYFAVSNTKKGQTYTFNIVNLDKINSQFNYGMQPVMFSVAEHLLTGAGWKRTGRNIIYYGNHLTNEDYSKQYRSLTFSIEFPYTNDVCYLAYHYPYTYSKLMKQLYNFARTDEKEIYIRLDSLCKTTNNNCVPLLTVTAPWKRKGLLIPLNKRPLVLLTARVHPGESNSSWIMDGFLKFLLDVRNEKAVNAREHYIFKIIPMLNVEGVIFGNTRSGLNGSDLNRCWKNPNNYQHPEVYYTKKLVEFAKTKLNHPITTFIDIHGHSRKKHYFFYGCNPLLSWNKHDRQSVSYTNCQTIPEEMKFDGNMRASFCQYKIERKKESTCRVVMWREFGIKGSLTLECSYCSGENKRVMTTQLLQNIGKNLLVALSNIASKHTENFFEF